MNRVGVRAAQNERRWRRLGGHFQVAGVAFDDFRDLFSACDDRFLEFELFTLQSLSFFLQIQAFDSPHLGCLFQLLRFETNFGTSFGINTLRFYLPLVRTDTYSTVLFCSIRYIN